MSIHFYLQLRGPETRSTFVGYYFYLQLHLPETVSTFVGIRFSPEGKMAKDSLGILGVVLGRIKVVTAAIVDCHLINRSSDRVAPIPCC
jgi:hypothetical protein